MCHELASLSLSLFFFFFSITFFQKDLNYKIRLNLSITLQVKFFLNFLIFFSYGEKVFTSHVSLIILFDSCNTCNHDLKLKYKI